MKSRDRKSEVGRQKSGVRGQKNIFRNFLYIFLLVVLPLVIFSCGKSYTPEQEKYISEIEKYRETRDSEMNNDPNSPFNQDPKADFHSLKYYNVDPDYVFKSKLFEYPEKVTVNVFGTKGETRQALKYGYVTFNFKGKDHRLNVYRGQTQNNQVYYSIWFVDNTTGKDTYGVGRYLDFEMNPDTNYIYTIDFNLAFNPYCAYSSKYSCAVPTKEDYIAMSIEAGEKNFHN